MGWLYQEMLVQDVGGFTGFCLFHVSPCLSSSCGKQPCTPFQLVWLLYCFVARVTDTFPQYLSLASVPLQKHKQNLVDRREQLNKHN